MRRVERVFKGWMGGWNQGVNNKSLQIVTGEADAFSRRSDRPLRFPLRGRRCHVRHVMYIIRADDSEK